MFAELISPISKGDVVPLGDCRGGVIPKGDGVCYNIGWFPS